MAHAFVTSGEIEPAVARAREYVAKVLGITETKHPDLVVLRYGLFSVDDARALADLAYAAPVVGSQKAVIVALTRIFHEAQNALLKLFEEPPPGVTLILVVPTEGLLLPTLRSRLAPLPLRSAGSDEAEIAREFIAAGDEERAKMAAKLIDRTKADKDEDKQRARNDAVLLLEGLARVAERAFRTETKPAGKRELRLLLEDLVIFLPLLHTRSAPLKLIFEHLLLVIPKNLRNSAV